MFCAYLRFEIHFSLVCLDYTKQAFVCQWAKSGLAANRSVPVENKKERGT